MAVIPHEMLCAKRSKAIGGKIDGSPRPSPKLARMLLRWRWEVQVVKKAWKARAAKLSPSERKESQRKLLLLRDRIKISRPYFSTGTGTGRSSAS